MNTTLTRPVASTATVPAAWPVDFDAIAAAHGSTVAAVTWPLYWVAHVLTADSRVLVVEIDINTGAVLDVSTPGGLARVDLAQCRDEHIVAKWNVAASFPSAS